VYGAPRFFTAARRAGIRPLVGAEVPVEGAGLLWLLVEDRDGYRNLCRLITAGALGRPQGEARGGWGQVGARARGLHCLPRRRGRPPAPPERRAPPEIPRRDGGALPRLARRDPPEPAHRRALRLHARRSRLPLPGVPAAAGRDADGPSPRAHVRGRPGALPGD